MMLNLNSEHKNKYPKLSFKSEKSSKAEAAIYIDSLLKDLERPDPTGRLQMAIGTNSMLELTTAIGKATLEEFVEKYEIYRDRLAEKKLRGKTLTEIEGWILGLLNEKLDELFAFEPTERHLQGEEALREAKRFLATRNR